MLFVQALKLKFVVMKVVTEVAKEIHSTYF